MLDSQSKKMTSTKSNRQDLPNIDTSMLNGVVQIRDILLGEHINSWESRIVNLEENIQNLVKQTNSKLKSMNERVEGFLSTGESRLSAMEEQLSKLVEETSSRLSAIEAKVAKSDNDLKEELETNLMDLEQENTDLRLMVEKFKNDFEQGINALDSGKVEKSVLADTFSQLAEMLKNRMEKKTDQDIV